MMTPNLRFWSVTQTGVVFKDTKPVTLKKEANFVVFIKNYRVYTSAAMTYLAGLFSSLASLIRLIAISNRRD